MAWHAQEPDGREVAIVLPREQPVDGTALQRWNEGVHRAARLTHPQLAPMREVGVQDGWPYVVHDLHARATLAERLPRGGLPGAEAAALAAQALRGLAFAHEAGIAHHDMQPYVLLVDDHGHLQLAGLAVAAEAAADETPEDVDASLHGSLQALRAAAERDVLALGLLLHGMMAGTPALDEPDISRAAARLLPGRREIVRLPWTLQHPVSDALRAIVNRATDRQPRQRYRNARTLLRALEGWLQTAAEADGGALALLGDRLRAAGALPASPGAAQRAARLALMEGQRTNDLADVVLEDLALSFELLRIVNTAQVRGTQVSGAGPVLTVRRAIAMVGLDGMRRAALGLRRWPGPLDENGAEALERLIDGCKRAGRVALALRPAGYDGEVVYLLTLLQNLGRLVLHYHFADEAQQIRRLMQPGPPARPGEEPEPGMSEEGAAFAVLGVDVEALGVAVARWWGLEDSVLQMIRRMPASAMVHIPDGDGDMLRLVASCANETVDALARPAPKVLPALQRVAQRYGRALGISVRHLQDALAGRAPSAIAETSTMPLDEAPAPTAAPATSGAR